MHRPYLTLMLAAVATSCIPPGIPLEEEPDEKRPILEGDGGESSISTGGALTASGGQGEGGLSDDDSPPLDSLDTGGRAPKDDTDSGDGGSSDGGSSDGGSSAGGSGDGGSNDGGSSAGGSSAGGSGDTDSCIPPVCLPQDAVTLSAGETHTCLLRDPEGLTCWGSDVYGELGNGPNLGNQSRAGVVVALDDIQSVEAGTFHTCALLRSGKLYCWGNNEYGQVGSSTVTQATVQLPVEVELPARVISVGAGWHHTCALLDDGSVWCWGSNENGRLGDPALPATGTRFPHEVPQVGGVLEIAVNGHHSCALIKTAEVYCWGWGHHGQIGGMLETTESGPVRLPLRDVRSIAAGFNHTCAILDDDTVRCWGLDDQGQIGDGPAIRGNRTSPVQVTGLENVLSLSLGDVHSCALLHDKTVTCWGNDGYGQVGDGSDEKLDYHFATPVGGLANVKELAAGGWHNCALLEDDSVWCWGNGGDGRLGNGDTTGALVVSPAPVQGL